MRTSSLSLEDVKYYLHLGCSASEREQLQEVQISVTVDFQELPKGCYSDKLDECLCYASINSRLEEVCQSKPFNTIEHLAQLCWDSLTPLLNSEDVMTLKILKVNPPLGKTLKGSVFQLRGQK